EAGQARTLEAAHRLARDAVSAQLVARQATPVAGSPGYPPPAPITDRTSAIRWAVEIEQSSAAGYRYLLECAVRAGGDQAAIRRQGLSGLTDAARAAAYWRELVSPDRPTVPFPGAP
ncbi:MAG TPA: DUF4439 domain-containing protein, partial [Jatrophihabitans sp.]|nr:DUF4439 domain-containing protein [Jatrophihabitans sp.]